MSRRRGLKSSDLGRAVARAFASGLEQRLAASPAFRTLAVDRSAELLKWSRNYLPHYFTKRPSEMHIWLAERAHHGRMHRGAFVNLVGPRGGAKSTVGNTANIVRCAVEGTEPYIWVVSETIQLAKKQLHSIKEEIEHNEQLAADYPEAVGIGPEWSAVKIRLNNRVAIEAIGKGQAIRGSRNRADRPTLIVCDDLQDEKVILSSDQRRKDWDWFTGSLLNAGDARTNFFNLSNALHREAIGMRLLETPGWESKVFSSIIQWPLEMGLWEQWSEIYHNTDNPNSVADARAYFEERAGDMARGAKLLWPEWEDLYFLMCLREKNGRGPFEREKQSRPINPEDSEWPESLFDDHIWFDDWPRTWQIKTLTLDPSKGKDARRSDYSAFVSLMVGVDGVLYVDGDLARRPTPQIVADGVAIYQQWKPDGFGVESNAWQELLGQDFGDEFRRQGMIDANPFSLDNRVNKLVRIRRLGPFLSQHRLKFKRGSPGAALIVSMMRDFPDKNAHDDGPDALEMAIRLAKTLLAAGAEDVDEFERV